MDGICLSTRKRRGYACAAAIVVSIVCLLTQAAQTQPAIDEGKAVSEAPSFAPRGSVPEVCSFVAGLFFPKLLQDAGRLKEYVTSDEYARLRVQYGDQYAVDAFFDRAMTLCWENTYAALFICLVATIEHRRVSFDLPLLGPLLSLPITSEFEDEFQARVAALPGRLYPDSPGGELQDKDKLQHFFGSAFLAHLFESRDASDRVAGLIEAGERRFVPDRGIDDRDVRANRQGQEFGLALLRDRSLLPSRFLTLHVKEDL
jgi:hypothetical protein